MTPQAAAAAEVMMPTMTLLRARMMTWQRPRAGGASPEPMALGAAAALEAAVPAAVPAGAPAAAAVSVAAAAASEQARGRPGGRSRPAARRPRRRRRGGGGAGAPAASPSSPGQAAGASARRGAATLGVAPGGGKRGARAAWLRTRHVYVKRGEGDWPMADYWLTD